MRKFKGTSIICTAIIIQILLAGGCSGNKMDNMQNNKQQEGSTDMNGENVTTYTTATKNTTRILGDNAERIALSTSCMIWPATEAGNRPKIVLIAPSESWQIQLIAADLIHHPSDGPLLITSKEKVSDAVLGELSRLNPAGGSDGTKVITVGISDNAVKQLTDKGYKTQQIKGDNINKLAEDIDTYYASVSGGLPNSVIVTSSEQAEYSIPAVNWIAHAPEPLLYVTKDSIPPETESALTRRNGKANIYLLGPESVISKNVEASLQKHGKVTRISGETPYANSIAFSKYKDKDTGFGWGVTMPGHGLVIVTNTNIKESIAAGAFSHRGKHAPMLITEGDKTPQELSEYLKQLKPYFQKDPTEGPYTHLFLAGGREWFSIEQQGNLDHLIEIEAAKGEGNNGADSNKMQH